MKIFYSYEAQGRQKSQRHCLYLNDTFIEEGLSYEDLCKYLKAESANLSENSVLCYYNEDINTYVTLENNDMIPYKNEVKILIRRGHSNPVHGMLERIDLLEKQVQSVEERLERKENEANLRPNTQEVHAKLPYLELDIVFLHASPLVAAIKSGFIPYEDSNLDYESEKIAFMENIQRACDIRFEALTPENFDELLEYMPKIIVVSCESYYKANGELVLAFEKYDISYDDHGEVGLLYEITSQQLKNMLLVANQYLQVVIVKGKHSQDMAKVFLNAGFSCVIAVNDMSHDIQATRFISEISNQLLAGETIEQAFSKVSRGDKPNDGFDMKHEEQKLIYHCCCAHSHKNNCLWVKSCNSTNGAEKHFEHSSENCCQNNGNYHSMQCDKVLCFGSKYGIDKGFACRTSPIQGISITQPYQYLCCCSPEVDHTKLKYSIFCNDDSVLDQSLFESHKKGKPVVRGALSLHLKPPQVKKFTIGRRMEIRELILMTMSTRCVNVIGDCGNGKTMLVKLAAQYAYERRIFKDGVVYLDFFMRTDEIFLYRSIANAMNLPMVKNYEALCSAINELDILLIIDNIDPMLQQYSNSIIEVYNNILMHTSKPKFIIASQMHLNLKGSKVYKIPQFSECQALSLLNHLNRHKKSSECCKNILNVIGKKPADILQISPLLKYDNLEDTIKSESESGISNFCAIKISLQYITKKFSKALDFLKLLSYFPSGAFKLNIESLCEATIPEYMSILEMLKSEGENTGTWFIHSDKDFDFILLRSNVANYFENNTQTKDMFKACLVHLAIFSRALLKSLLNSPIMIGAEIRNSLFYVNAGIENGMWSPLNAQESGALAGKIMDPSQKFTKFETNFWYYIDIMQINKKIQNIDEETAKALAEIILCTSSIFILLGKTYDALEVIKRGKACCEHFNLDKVESMLNLMTASVKIQSKSFSDVNNHIESSKKYFCNTDDLEGQAECHLLKSIVKEETESLAELSLIRSLSTQEVDGELKKSINLFRRALQDLGCARAQLAHAEYKLKTQVNDSEIESDLQDAISVFKKFGFKSWETRARICLSDWYYNGHNVVKSREILSSINLKKGDVMHDSIITDKLRKINEIIRSTNGHVISLIKSFPLVEKSSNDQINRAGSIWRYYSNFRTDLFDVLKNTQKKLCVRDDIGNRVKFLENLKDKCTILHLSSEVFSINHLILEGEKGLADVLTFEDFSRLVNGSLKSYGVELLVLAMPLSSQLGQFCYDNLQVKHVVCFNFLEYPKDGVPAQAVMIIDKAIEKFSIEFYRGIVEGMSVRNAFYGAKGAMHKFISEEILRFKFLRIKGKNLIMWWEEYHKNEPLLINETSLEHDECVLSSGNSEGSFIEMSNLPGPSNVDRANLNFFVGRQVEVHNVMNALEETKCVNVFGEEGIGKTQFVSQVVHHLNVRNKYSDGIFLLNLQGKSSLYEVYDSLQEVGLAFYSADIVPTSFLLQKKMLLVLDNCDELYTKAYHTFLSLLSIFLQECKISLLIATNMQIQAHDIYNIKKIALRTLNSLESQVVLTMNSQIFYSQMLETQEKMEAYEEGVNKIIRECKGVPKKLIRCAHKLEKHKNEMEQQLMRMRRQDFIEIDEENVHDDGLLSIDTRRRTVNAFGQNEDLYSNNMHSNSSETFTIK